MLVILNFRHMQEYTELTDPPASQRNKGTSLKVLLICCSMRVMTGDMVLWVSFAPTHGNLAKETYILDIQWLLLMETLSPCGHSFQRQMEFPFRKILAPISSEQLYVTGRV